MLVRKAETKDIPALQTLLKQVGNVHHEGRPDLFLPDTCKYNGQEFQLFPSGLALNQGIDGKQKDQCSYSIDRQIGTKQNPSVAESPLIDHHF